MSYNYDPSFLGRHSDLVAKLIETCQQDAVFAIPCQSYNELASQRQLISNLLASLALNFPQFKPVRQSLRTWAEHTDRESAAYTWTLYVGKPIHRVRGRPPGDAGRSGAEPYKDYMNTVTEPIAAETHPKIMHTPFDIATALMDYNQRLAPGKSIIINSTATAPELLITDEMLEKYRFSMRQLTSTKFLFTRLEGARGTYTVQNEEPKHDNE